MNQKGLSLVLAILFLLPGMALIPFASSHPPSDMVLEYHYPEQMLNVTITHESTRPLLHYVRTVRVENNGEHVVTFVYVSHPGNVHTYRYNISAQYGDVLTVIAQCNEGGNISQDIVVSWLPEAPRNLVASAGDSSVSMVWNPPIDTGGLGINFYNIYRRHEGKIEHIGTSPAGHIGYFDVGLANDDIYEYMVTAVNNNGEGPATAWVSAVPKESRSISLLSNMDFHSYPNIFSGSGVPGDPWVLEDRLIAGDGTGYGIYMKDTSDHVVIKNNVIANVDKPNMLGGGSGIYIQNVENVFIEHNTFSRNIEYGIRIIGSSDIHVEGNRISGSENGIYMRDCHNVQLTRNFVNTPPKYSADGMLYDPGADILDQHGKASSADDPPGSPAVSNHREDSVIVKFRSDVNLSDLDMRLQQESRRSLQHGTFYTSPEVYGPHPWPEYSPGEPAWDLLLSLENMIGGRFTSVFPSFGMSVMSLEHGQKVESAVRELSMLPWVEYAEPDFIVQPLMRPNDPDYSRLWNLHRLYGIDAIGAWETTTGSKDVVVAVLDTGVDYNHEDLRNNMWVGPNGEHGYNALENNLDPMDKNGHGTHVSGTLGAVGNNNIGITGVNWDVSIMALKFLGEQGGTVSGAIACMEYVLQRKQEGVNVVATSNSWGGGSYSKALYDAIERHRDAGILFVAASGNSHLDNDIYSFFPAGFNLTNIISVTSYNANMEQVYNYGEGSVHVGAPGVNIYSTLPGNGYGSRRGTSMSAPHVSGLAALIASANPVYDYVKIKNLIMSSTTQVSSFEGKTISGGILNANTALGSHQPELNVYIQGPFSVAGHDVGMNMLGSPLDITVMVSDGISPIRDANVEISFSTGEDPLYPVDNGVLPDQVAMDGYYTARWVPMISGDVTMTISVETNIGSKVLERTVEVFGGRRGLYMTHCSNVLVDNNTIAYSVEGIFVNMGNSLTFEGNTISNIRGSSLRLSMTRDVIVKNSDFLRTGASSVLLEGVEEVVFENCALTPWRRFVGSGIVARNTIKLSFENITVDGFYNSMMFDNVANVSMLNGTLLDNMYSGIFLDDSEDALIAGNDISGGIGGVVVRRSNDVVIYDNNISYVDMGLECSSSRNTLIASNRISHINGRGISLLYSESPTIFDNTIEFCAVAGVSSIMSSDIVIDANRFFDNFIGVDLKGGYETPNSGVDMINNIFSRCETSVFSDSAENVFVRGGSLQVPMEHVGLRSIGNYPVSVVNVELGGSGTAFVASDRALISIRMSTFSNEISRYFVLSGSAVASLQDIEVAPYSHDNSKYSLEEDSYVSFLKDFDIGVRDTDGFPLFGAEITIQNSLGSTVYYEQRARANTVARCLWKRYTATVSGVDEAYFTPHTIRAAIGDMWDRKVVDMSNTSSALLVPMAGRPSINQPIPDIFTNRNLARTPAVDLRDYFQHNQGLEVLSFYGELREVLETSSGEEGSGLKLSGDQGRYVDVVPMQDWHGKEIHRIYATDTRTTVHMDVLVVVRDSDSAIIPLGLPSVYMRDGITIEYGSLQDYFIDPKGLELDFSVDILEGDGVELYMEDDVLFVQSDSRWEGVVKVEITARNTQGENITSILLIKVHHVNQRPVSQGLPDVKLLGGESIEYGDLNKYFYDPDGDVLTFRVVSKNSIADVHIDEGNILYIESFANQWGPEEVTIMASDAWGAFTTASFTIYVERYNFPVESSSIPPFSLHDNTVASNALYLYDHFRDPDRYPEPMTFWHTGGDNLGITKHLGMVSLNPSTGTPHSQLPRTFIVTFHATDGEYTASEVWAVTILKEEIPPVLTAPLPDIDLYSGEQKSSKLNLGSYFHSLDPVEYTFHGSGVVDISISIEGMVTFQAPLGWDGVESITFRASNEYGFAEDIINVAVTHIPAPPVWKPLPTAVMDEDGSLERWIDLHNFMESAETSVSSLRFDVKNRHSEVSVFLEENTLSIHPRQGWYGTVSIVVSVSDGFTIVNTTLDIEVNVVNQPPTAIISSPEQRSAHYSRTRIAFDAGESTHREGLSEYVWDMGDGRIRTGASMHHTYSEEGKYTVVLTVVDIHGGKDTISIDIIVENSPPAITSVYPEERNVEMKYGGRRTFYAETEDLNDPVLTYTWKVGGEEIYTGTGFVFNPPSTGLFLILLEVSDGVDAVTFSWTVEVHESPDGASSSPIPPSSSSLHHGGFANMLSSIPSALLAPFFLAFAAIIVFAVRRKRRRNRAVVVITVRRSGPDYRAPVVTLISK